MKKVEKMKIVSLGGVTDSASEGSAKS